MIAWYWIVIFSFFSIIPSLVVLVVLFLRQEALRGDVNSSTQKVALVFSEYQQITSQYKAIQDTIADVSTKAHALGKRADNIDESFVALSNKWNSRERAEKQAEKRRRKEEEEQQETQDVFSIPGTEQQTIPFPPQPEVSQPQKRKRQFGEMP